MKSVIKEKYFNMSSAEFFAQTVKRSFGVGVGEIKKKKKKEMVMMMLLFHI